MMTELNKYCATLQNLTKLEKQGLLLAILWLIGIIVQMWQNLIKLKQIINQPVMPDNLKHYDATKRRKKIL